MKCWWQFVNLFSILLNLLIRNQFLNQNILRRLMHHNKMESINIIKFTGRAHSRMTSVMDQLNVCYSFKVFLSYFHQFFDKKKIIKILCMLYAILDNDYYWTFICINDFHFIQAISQYPTKHPIHWRVFNDFCLGNI